MGDAYLNYQDANGNGRYDYLAEPGELLVYAQDANGDGIPDRGTLMPWMRMVPPMLDDNGEQMWQCRTPRTTAIRGTASSCFPPSRTRTATAYRTVSTPTWSAAVACACSRMPAWCGMNLWPKNPHNNNLPWLNDDMTWKDRTRIENFRFRLGTEVVHSRDGVDCRCRLDLDAGTSHGRPA